MTNILSPVGKLTVEDVTTCTRDYGTPVYIYDEQVIIERCQNLMNMPNAYGLEPRYAMKANSNKAILQLVSQQGLKIDASSLNEARRANAAGIPLSDIMLTTQECPVEDDRRDLERMLVDGMHYNVCSILQLKLIAETAAKHDIPLSMRVHPGVGSGESATRNTGDKYSCFGVHLSNLEEALRIAEQNNLTINQVHVHIGSGGDPEKWRENIDRELNFIEKYFPKAERVSFGGGFKEARMPGETVADIVDLGNYAKQRIEEFYERTGRKLIMEVEPGTYIVANSGYLATSVIDKKETGKDGFEFIVVDGGMEVNTRPLLYGSTHPFFFVSNDGKLLSSDFADCGLDEEKDQRIIVGRCCESGDSQTLSDTGTIVPRVMADPEVGDIVTIGGCGAYCSSMSPFNYNSHVQAPEVLRRTDDGTFLQIRKRQTIEQITQNEIGLPRPS